MSALNFNLLTTLPALGEPGSRPPLDLEEFLNIISVNERAVRIAKVIFVAEDILRREAASQNGEAQAPMVLTPEEFSAGSLSLPEPVRKRISIEEEWFGEADIEEEDFVKFLNYAFITAEEEQSTFVRELIGFEVALRNALVRYRAKKLDKDPGGHELAREMEARDVDLYYLFTRIEELENPGDQTFLVEQIRWDWVLNNDCWFTFSDDEVAAYGIKLFLLQRWYRMEQDKRISSEIAQKFGVEKIYI